VCAKEEVDRKKFLLLDTGGAEKLGAKNYFPPDI